MPLNPHAPTVTATRAAATKPSLPALMRPGASVDEAVHALDAPTMPALRRDALPLPRDPQKTPCLPATPLSRGRTRATLTLMSGVDAGRVFPIESAALVLGRSFEAHVRVDDLGVSRVHARVAREPSGGYILEDLGSTNGTFVGDERVRIVPLHAGDHVQLGPNVIFRFGMTSEIDDVVLRNLSDASTRDPLTRLFNRRYLAERLDVELKRVRRGGDKLAAILFDVDQFKAFNDRFGHLAGDRALCIVAAELSASLREDDFVARYGGEEFLVIARGVDLDGAARLAERLRRAVEALPFTAGGRAVRITVSAGVASLSEVAPPPAPAPFLALADERLFLAKRAGRNRVCASADAHAATFADGESAGNKPG